MKRLASIVALCIFSASFVFSSPVGNVSGTVKDSSGAIVPSVKLTLTSTATNAQLTTTTNASGEFQFLQLAPTTYTLVAEAAGFKKINVSSVLVQVDQITHLDLVLEVGTVTESVQVESAAPLLETDKSTISTVVDSRNIGNMPLNGRQALDLALITPGVTPTAAGTQVLSFNNAGARSQSNTYLWDGASNMDTQVNGNLNNFRIGDAVQEFSVQTSVASAEFGRGTGGTVSVVTKSGTNSVHGTMFEYLRNNDFDATDFFINKQGATKTPLHRNTFGGTLGGPIKRNKTFVFGSFESIRQVNPTPSLTRVPTAAERAMVTDPISKALLKFWPDPNTTGGNNFIANANASIFDYTGLIRVDHKLSERDQLSVRFADYQGVTFTAGALPLEGGNGNTPVSRNGVLTETHTFSPTMFNEFRAGYSRNQTFITVQDIGLDASKIFVDSTGKPLPGVVDATKNIQDSGLPTITVAGGFAPLGSTTNLPQGRITNTFEVFDNMSWVAPFGASRHSFRFGFHQRREQARRYLDSNERGSFTFSGTASAVETAAAASWREFAAGLVNSSTFKTGSTLAYWDRFPWDIYWQDQWKVRDNLTLNYGVRYEYPSAIYQHRQDATNFIPGVGPVLLGTNQLLSIDPTKKGPASLVLGKAPITLSDSGVTSDKNNIAPVIGMAYTPRFAKGVFGNDDTVIRAGFRIGYDDIFNNIPANMGLNAPYNLSTTQNTNTAGGKFSYATGFDQNVPLVKFDANGKPLVGLVGFNAEDPNIRSSYLYQYNVGIQRRLGQNFSLEVDYQGSAGHKLGLFVDQNQPTPIVKDSTFVGQQGNGKGNPNLQVYPYPTFGAIGTGVDIGNSHYNGMVSTAKYQSPKGYFLQATYTWSHSIDYTSAFFGSTGELSTAANPKQLNLERAPSSFDTRHRAVVVYNVDLPMGHGHRLATSNNIIDRQLLGGWSISGITSAQTGQPFTVYNTAQDFSGFNQFGDRPDYIGSGPLVTNYSNPDLAFSPSAFSATPPTGRVGTAGRNEFVGPGLVNYDFTTLKTFPVWHERTYLTLRADFFNLFNHTNFANPGHNEGSAASFGKITQTLGSAVATAVGTTAGANGGPRTIQFALRLTF
jgi:hypothetical protein